MYKGALVFVAFLLLITINLLLLITINLLLCIITILLLLIIIIIDIVGGLGPGRPLSLVDFLCTKCPCANFSRDKDPFMVRSYFTTKIALVVWPSFSLSR